MLSDILKAFSQAGQTHGLSGSVDTVILSPSPLEVDSPVALSWLLSWQTALMENFSLSLFSKAFYTPPPPQPPFSTVTLDGGKRSQAFSLSGGPNSSSLLWKKETMPLLFSHTENPTLQSNATWCTGLKGLDTNILCISDNAKCVLFTNSFWIQKQTWE